MKPMQMQKYSQRITVTTLVTSAFLKGKSDHEAANYLLETHFPCKSSSDEVASSPDSVAPTENTS
jgi:hypothetical protein